MGLPRFWVNTASLSLLVSDTDLTYSGLGPDMEMTRTYNSNDPELAPGHPYAGIFGNGWSFTYEGSVTETGIGAAVTQGEGSTLFFSGPLATPPVAPVTNLTPPQGNFDSLSYLFDAGAQIHYWLYENKKKRLSYRYENATGVYRLVSITDKSGNKVRITHNPDGTIQKVTDAAGRATTFAYDANRHCTTMTAPNSTIARYEYDGTGNLKKTTDLAGNITTFTYDVANYLTSMTLGDKVSLFTYDPNVTPQRISSVTNALGQVVTYQRSGFNETTVLDQSGNSALYGANDRGMTEQTTDANGLSAGSKVFTNKLLDTFTSPGGWTKSFTYDARGNTLTSTESSSYGDGRNTTSYNYDNANNLTGKVDAENPSWVWQYGYDASGNRTSVRRPDATVTAYGYTGGKLTTITDARGKVSTFTYDPSGNNIGSSDPTGNTSSRTYDSIGNMLTETDPAGNTTSYQYDGNRRITKITHADGTFKSFQYDCCSLIGTTDENGHTTTIVRNKLLRPVSITDPLNKTTTYTYDSLNRLVSTTQPDNSVTTMTPDKLGRPSVITDALGNSRTFTYNGDWNIDSLTDERGNSTQFFFDHGRPSGSLGPLTVEYANRQTTKWDKSGRLDTWINGNYGGVTFSYTPSGKIAAKSSYYPAGLLASYTYDTTGNMTRMDDQWGATLYGYDDAGRTTSIHYPDNSAVSIGYAAIGRTNLITYPTGVNATYTFDKRNRIKTMTFGGQSASFAYDGVGNLLSETRSNGVTSTYVYDARNQVTGISHAKGGTPFSQVTYVRDAMGNITNESGTYPLAPAVSPSTAGATYNAMNQINQWGGDSYSYDFDGNLVSVSGSRAISTACDQENRVTSITQGGATTTYIYDGKGNRVRSVSGTAVVNSHYDQGGRLLFQKDGAGQTTAMYFYAGSRLVGRWTTQEGYQFYHFDKTGNTIALTDVRGAVARAYAYLPFGEKIQVPQADSTMNPFTFVGAYGVLDDGNGRYFMKTRMYDATTGRFMQRDPAGFIGGTNLYRYAGNNPLVRIDPSGFDDEDVSGIMEGTANLNTGELPVSINDPDDDQAIYDVVGDTAEAAYYVGDKAMNYAPETPGTFYTLGKVCYNLYKGGSEGRVKAGLELVKMAVGSYYGGTYGLAADLYQDAMEGQLSYLKKRAAQIPDDNPRWGKVGRIDF